MHTHNNSIYAHNKVLKRVNTLEKDVWPNMEKLSSRAIEEMVENAFKSADLNNDGVINFEKFKKWVCVHYILMSMHIYIWI